MKWIKKALKSVLIAGAFYLGFAYGAGFTMRQSLVLAATFAILDRILRRVQRKPDYRFNPYYVVVTVKLSALVGEFHLTDKREGWRMVPEPDQEFKYVALNEGIRFTVINPSDVSRGVLVYSNSSRFFSSEVDLKEIMVGIKNEKGMFADDPLFGVDHVQVFVQSGGAGYDIGITVPQWWWQEMKESCPKPIKESEESSIGQVRLVLATLPYREFDWYWETLEQEDDATRYVKTQRQIRERRDEQLKKFGWQPVDWDPDGPLSRYTSIEHKYFKVEHRGI